MDRANKPQPRNHQDGVKCMTALIVLFIALQIADIATTIRALDHGARELNPVVRWFMAHLGTLPGLMVVKGAGGAVIIAGVLVARSYAPIFALIALVAICGAYGLVVWRNWRNG